MAITYTQVAASFTEEGVILCTPEEAYRNVSQVLDFVCPLHPELLQKKSAHNVGMATYPCELCANEALTNHRRTPYATIQAAFDVRGYDLLTTKAQYTTTESPLVYRCRPHHQKTRTIWYHNMTIQNKGCRACANNIKRQKSAEMMFPIARAAFTKQG
ncbi:hypothetical protein GC096_11925 [Paenibacillus sp. LMG 31461]|uniref:Uncharacterized protein n=1 Tax=Paenibacillus plantarum TaxID=2654975 RepID=A0ABX1X8S4_9BACL|nr:hypothetical protein [Paenibacillus plantarum]NOU64734.1 hypothetical protein [Paenibacillus plantarum]